MKYCDGGSGIRRRGIGGVMGGGCNGRGECIGEGIIVNTEKVAS